jgi:hypothetical protein
MFAAVCFLLTSALSMAQSIRVGAYDSRAIAVAYAHSDLIRDAYRTLMEERDKAKNAGDEKRVKEIEAKGKAQQERLHLQGFSTGSVVDLMQKISQEIPGIAKDAGVVLIVSKWEVMYRTPSVECVDVTMPLVRKFGAEAQVLKMVEDLMKQEPVSADKLAMDFER